MQIAILMTCFNRKATTLACLDALARTVECSRSAGELSRECYVDIWLNDDGSTDGTSAAVQEWHSSLSLQHSTFSLNLIRGSGSDYWCGGMRRAWKAAAESGVKYDGYLWLNDDTFLLEDGLSLMLSGSPSAIVVGAICDRHCKRMTYGGSYARGDMIPVNGSYQPVEKVHGNCVWVPQSVFLKMGNFQPYLTHALGDVDYSRRALRAGVPLVLTPRYVGMCDANPQLPDWRRSEVPLLRRIRNLYSPLGYCEPLVYFRFCLYHDGLWVALKSFLLQHIRVLFPALWRKDRQICAS